MIDQTNKLLVEVIIILRQLHGRIGLVILALGIANDYPTK